MTSELEKVEGKTDKDVARKRQARLSALLQEPDTRRFRQFKRPPKPTKVKAS